MIVSPGKWVSEEQLIALKGIKKGTLKKAREKSFMEGREYKHVAHDGMPWDNSLRCTGNSGHYHLFFF